MNYILKAISFVTLALFLCVAIGFIRALLDTVYGAEEDHE